MNITSCQKLDITAKHTNARREIILLKLFEDEVEDENESCNVC